MADVDTQPAIEPVLRRRTRVIDDIERTTAKQVTIETAETRDTLAKCNPQNESVLFNTLPRELRDLIWAFATAPYEDKNNTYAETEYYHRPGHKARLETDFALLLTCRRIWLEASALPMLQAEHCFWFYRAAPDGRNHQWMANLTKQNRLNFGVIHQFAQMFAIEGLSSTPGAVRYQFLKTRNVPGDFQPRVLHVTIRHTDWWYWEDEAPLVFKDSWLQAILDSPDLRSTHTIKLELETLNYKVSQLMPIVKRLSNLHSSEYPSHIVDGNPTPTRFVLQGQPQVEEWRGPSNINGQTFRPYDGLEYLEYHIVTLTWRLQFPGYPRAHVPLLRLAPRIEPDNTSENQSAGSLWRVEYLQYHWTRYDEPRSSPSHRSPEPRYREFHMAADEQIWRFDMDGNLEDLGMLSRMMDEQLLLAHIQQHQTDDLEAARRITFEEALVPLRTTQWEKHWKAENALLSFSSSA